MNWAQVTQQQQAQIYVNAIISILFFFLMPTFEFLTQSL